MAVSRAQGSDLPMLPTAAHTAPTLLPVLSTFPPPRHYWVPVPCPALAPNPSNAWDKMLSSTVPISQLGSLRLGRGCQHPSV